MKTFNFARNTTREYFDVPAETEEEARKLLGADEGEYRSGQRENDEDEQPFELIDVEE